MNNIFFKKYLDYVKGEDETIEFSFSDINIFLEPGFEILSKEILEKNNSDVLGKKKDLASPILLQEYFWQELQGYKESFGLTTINGSTLLKLAANFYNERVKVFYLIMYERNKAYSIIRELEKINVNKTKESYSPKTEKQRILENEIKKAKEKLIHQGKKINLTNIAEVMNVVYTTLHSQLKTYKIKYK
jgi:hypothetical protein